MCNCARSAACVFVLERRSKFDLLFEVIFKDLAVPAVSVKLALGIVLAVAMFY